MKTKKPFPEVVLSLLFTIMSYCAFGQQGVYFEKGKSWQQILGKAKAENKYVFIDCYTTWCGPCKMMDRDIYPNDSVGGYMNEHYLSVKVQMDKTPVDDQDTKKWYEDAAMLERNYSVNAYPTFLFFSPDGKPVHKAVGAKLPPSTFLEMARDAQNPDKQYYNVLDNFQPGKIDTAELKGLAYSLRYDKRLSARIALDYLERSAPDQLFNPGYIEFVEDFKDDSLITQWAIEQISKYKTADFSDKQHQDVLAIFKDESIVQESVRSYFAALKTNQLKVKEILLLLSKFTILIEPNDRYFNLFYDNPAQTDGLLGYTGISEHVVDKVIKEKITQPELSKSDSMDKEPDWKKLGLVIQKKTNTDYAERNITNAKRGFYRQELAKAEERNSIEKFKWGKKLATMLSNQLTFEHLKTIQPRNYPPKEQPLSLVFLLNNNAFEIFQYSSDKKELQKALLLVNKSLEFDNNYADGIDTKANLLYKLGKREEALKLEEKAASLNPKSNDITDNFKNMKKGKPTWPVEEKKK
ncbi:MAG TPA: DUF255 domain-containing protein [Puia sp.]